MKKKEVLQKIAGLWSGVINAGANLGKGLLKNSPKITSFAGNHSKLFSSAITGAGGALIGTGVGALKNPGTDQFGQPKSRLKSALIGAGIGAAGGGLLGSGKLGQGFGLAVKDPNRASKLISLKKPLRPMRKILGTAAVVGATAGAMGTAGKLLETQSNQTQYGNQNPNQLRNV